MSLTIGMAVFLGFAAAASTGPIGRTIHLEATVEAPIEEAFRFFATADGVRALFPGAEAVIGDRVGGPYTVIFDPAGSPDGADNGTKGCRILALEESRLLTFQWRFPTWADELNIEPPPTWVEVLFAPVDAGTTTIVLDHRGFGDGPLWDRLFEYFTAAWERTLHGLEQRLATAPDIAPPPGIEVLDLYAVLLRPGPNWVPGRPAGEQPRLANHAAYMYALMARGVVHLAGPIGDEGRGLTVLAVPDEDGARRLCEADPAVQAGTFTYELLPWRARQRATP